MMTFTTEEPAAEQLWRFLKLTSKFMRKQPQRETDGGYMSLMEFLDRHGREYTAGPWTGAFKQGIPKQCFANSFRVAVETGLHYVEGYAVGPNFTLPVQHAWDVDEQGNALDITWKNDGRAYIGVEFASGRVDDAILNGTGCVLDDWHRNFPVLQSEWTGEDFEKAWPETEQTKVIRNFGPRYRRTVS